VSEIAIEEEIIRKGLVAPLITLDLINSVIKKYDYHVFADSTLTICRLTLVNGFVVTGESACASPENFDPVKGRRIAYENARDKIWVLEGYLLKQKLHDGVITQ
jgi:hypothetical protein